MISLTNAAATAIKNSLEKRGQGLGIRVGVKTTGCSGLSYVLEYVDNQTATDKTFESEGVTVFVDERDLVYISGLEMDWRRHGLNEGFEFINPNEQGRCGCGESFTV